MKKKISFLLCLLLLLCLLPVSAFAAGEERVLLSTPEEWNAAAASCVSDAWSRGKTLVLTADLDFSQTGFTPIPLLSGKLDGNGHTLKGITFTESASVTGVIRQVLEGALVEEVNVSAQITPDGKAETVGGIVGRNRGTVRNCSAWVTVSGSRQVGGVAGHNDVTGVIEDCVARGSVTGQHRAGGIAGENAGEIRLCRSLAEVNTTVPKIVTPDAMSALQQFRQNFSAEEIIDITDLGGVAGLSSGVIWGCENRGSVGYPNVGYNVGGIAGHQSGSVENCVNNGTVKGRKDVGGVSGQLDPEARWHLEESDLNKLRAMLDELQTRVNTLLRDVDSEKSGLTDDLSAIRDAVSRSGDAAEALSDAASQWTDTNLEAINELSRRVDEMLEDLVPVTEQLSGFTGVLPLTFDRLEASFRAFSQAAEDTVPAEESLRRALRGLEDALESGKAASDSLGDCVRDVRRAMGDGDETNAALQDLAGSLRDLSQAGRDIAQKIEEMEAAVGTEGLPEAVLAFWSSLREDISQMAESLTDGADALSRLVGQSDPQALRESLNDLRAALSDLGEGAESLQGASADLRRALSQLEDVSDDLSQGMNAAADAADALEDGLVRLDEAAEGITGLLEKQAKKPPVQLTPLDPDGPYRTQLFRSLEEVSARVGALNDDVREGGLTEDVRSITDQTFSISQFLLEVGDRAKARSEDDWMEDISAGEEHRQNGSVRACENNGDVSAETNAGGIVGAATLELSFDQEDQLDLSSLLSGGAKYWIYAVISECENRASVSAKKTASGGIAGRMDYGAALNCVSGGSVSSGGDYAGGIAGFSGGTVRGCMTRGSVSAGNYLGGIVGCGNNVAGCLSMPDLRPGGEYRGAVAGEATGNVSQNYYAESAEGGVNGFSFTGQCDAVSYEALVELSENADLFCTITVTFTAEGRTVAVVTVPFGGRVDSLPNVPDRDGAYWRWDAFENDAICRSMTVEGRYVRPATTLSTGEDVPRILVEGTFYEGQTLSAEDVTETLTPREGDVPLDALTLSVNDWEGTLTVRLRQEEDCLVFVAGEDGFSQAESRRDGSYVVFEMENGGTFYTARRKKSPLPYILGGCGGAAALAGAGGLIARSRKKKKVSA